MEISHIDVDLGYAHVWAAVKWLRNWPSGKGSTPPSWEDETLWEVRAEPFHFTTGPHVGCDRIVLQCELHLGGIPLLRGVNYTFEVRPASSSDRNARARAESFFVVPPVLRGELDQWSDRYDRCKEGRLEVVVTSALSSPEFFVADGPLETAIRTGLGKMLAAPGLKDGISVDSVDRVGASRVEVTVTICPPRTRAVAGGPNATVPRGDLPGELLAHELRHMLGKFAAAGHDVRKFTDDVTLNVTAGFHDPRPSSPAKDSDWGFYAIVGPIAAIPMICGIVSQAIIGQCRWSWSTISAAWGSRTRKMSWTLFMAIVDYRTVLDVSSLLGLGAVPFLLALASGVGYKWVVLGYLSRDIRLRCDNFNTWCDRNKGVMRAARLTGAIAPAWFLVITSRLFDSPWFSASLEGHELKHLEYSLTQIECIDLVSSGVLLAIEMLVWHVYGYSPATFAPLLVVIVFKILGLCVAIDKIRSAMPADWRAQPRESDGSHATSPPRHHGRLRREGETRDMARREVVRATGVEDVDRPGAVITSTSRLSSPANSEGPRRGVLGSSPGLSPVSSQVDGGEQEVRLRSPRQRDWRNRSGSEHSQVGPSSHLHAPPFNLDSSAEDSGPLPDEREE